MLARCHRGDTRTGGAQPWNQSCLHQRALSRSRRTDHHHELRLFDDSHQLISQSVATTEVSGIGLGKRAKTLVRVSVNRRLGVRYPFHRLVPCLDKLGD